MAESQTKAKRKRTRREVFVFTPEEKKAAACVLGALLLGLLTRHYREAHPRKPPPLSERQHYQAQKAARAAAAYTRSARGRAGAPPGGTTPKPSPLPEPDEEDE
jgi:hypothetical protein